MVFFYNVKSDKFYLVEQKLYEEYSQLRNENIYCIANGELLDKNKTIEENHIKNGDHVVVCYKEL